jgi:uncharacterized phage-associated protein
MATVFEVANYFLSLADEEAGDLVSNLKLQKLVYYAQGFHLALFDRPLFDDPIEAWTHGPVVPTLYHRFKDYGFGHIPRPVEFDPATIDGRTRELLDEVHNVYGQYSAWKLRNMTHEEAPWLEAYRMLPGSVIPHDSMSRYFKTLLQ